jgi:hypothetical protein
VDSLRPQQIASIDAARSKQWKIRRGVMPYALDPARVAMGALGAVEACASALESRTSSDGRDIGDLDRGGAKRRAASP